MSRENKYPYSPFTNTQLPLLKVTALWFDKRFILDPVGASWDTIGADHVSRDAVRQLKSTGLAVQVAAPADVWERMTYETAIR